MTKEEIFEYLSTHLQLDYDRDYYGKSLTVMLKLHHPTEENKVYELGSVYIDIPDIEVGSGRSNYY